MMDLVKLWIIKGTRKFETSKRPSPPLQRKESILSTSRLFQ
jgi:hypothetical protein